MNLRERQERGNREYAVVLIPTMDRYEHFVRCIDSLRDNSLAKDTKLYIAVDHPNNTERVEGHTRIIEYINEGIDGFEKVTVYRHDHNLGARANAGFLYDKIQGMHDRYIFTEDDNVFSPCYLEYVNDCLDEYENDENVWAISGYMWPVSSDDYLGNVCKIDSIFSAWGYASWIHKENRLREKINLGELNRIFRNKSLMGSLRARNPFIYTEFVKGYVEYSGCLLRYDEVAVIDLSYGVCMFANNLCAIYPILTKVRNEGNDGSGDNCERLDYDKDMRISHRNYDYSSQLTDQSEEFCGPKMISVSENQRIEERLGDFLFIPKSELIVTDVIYRLTLVLGRERVRDIIGRLFRYRRNP